MNLTAEQTQNFHKEIDLIQDCITRMADCSFKIKNLYLTLLAAGAVFLLQNKNVFAASLFALVLTLVFWYLDAFYLKTENQFRWKFQWLIENRPKGNEEFLFNLNPHKVDMQIKGKGKPKTVFGFMFTKTLTPLYGVVAFAALVGIVFCGSDVAVAIQKIFCPCAK